MNFIISLLIAFVAINVIAAIPLIGVGVLGWDYLFGVKPIGQHLQADIFQV